MNASVPRVLPISVGQERASCEAPQANLNTMSSPLMLQMLERDVKQWRISLRLLLEAQKVRWEIVRRNFPSVHRS